MAGCCFPVQELIVVHLNLPFGLAASNGHMVSVKGPFASCLDKQAAAAWVLPYRRLRINRTCSTHSTCKYTSPCSSIRTRMPEYMYRQMYTSMSVGFTCTQDVHTCLNRKSLTLLKNTLIFLAQGRTLPVTSFAERECF